MVRVYFRREGAVGSHQGGRGRRRVQEGREVLVRVRVLMLVVVLMELDRQGLDVRLVLGRPAPRGGARRGAGGGRAPARCGSTRPGRPRPRPGRGPLGAGRVAVPVPLLRGHEVRVEALTQQLLICRRCGRSYR